MALLKTIFIIVLVYYLFKLLLRLFAPKIINFAAKKTEAHFKERFGDFAQQNTTNEEQVGDVIIEKKPKRSAGSSDKVGDYIDAGLRLGVSVDQWDLALYGSNLLNEDTIVAVENANYASGRLRPRKLGIEAKFNF